MRRSTGARSNNDLINQRLAVAKGIAGGGAAGEVWHEGLQSDSPIDVVYDMAKDALLKRAPTTYKTKGDELRAHLDEWTACASVFHIRPESADFMSEVETTIRRLYTSWAEGILLTLFTTEQDRKALKSKVHGVQNALHKAKVPWDNVLDHLRRKSTDALKMKATATASSTT